MIKWIFEKIVGWPWCSHKWETKNRIPVAGPDSNLPIRYDIELCCEKCGDWKLRKL